jgi:uncharacterized membrane protein YkvA (DUF1232 family)
MHVDKAGGHLAKDVTNLTISWKEQAQRLQKEALVLYFVFKNSRTPWYVRGVAVCSAAYLFSPVQFIPSFIPVIGFLDDFLIVLGGAKLVRRFTPPELLRECHEQAAAAEARRSEEIQPGLARFAIVLSAATWLLAAVAVSALLTAYLYR